MENGSLVREVTRAIILKRNSFIFWMGGKTKDCDLKVDYRVSACGNSGINYLRLSIESPPFSMKSYQADIDGEITGRARIMMSVAGSF